MAERDWNWRDRLGFWVKVLSMSIAIATAMSTCALVTGKWAYTRASVDDIEALDRTKEDKINATAERTKIEVKLNTQTQVLGNVRDNLILMMDRQNITTKPLPAGVSPLMPNP